MSVLQLLGEHIIRTFLKKKVLLRHCSETVVKYRAVTATDFA